MQKNEYEASKYFGYINILIALPVQCCYSFEGKVCQFQLHFLKRLV